MNVSNVQLVAIRGKEVFGNLYEFDDPSWVGLGEERGKHRFGPASLLDVKTSRVKAKDVEITETEFPAASLAEIDGQLLYKDEWTIFPGTLFIIVLPPRWVARNLFTSFEGRHPRLMEGVDADGALCYYGTLSNVHPAILRIEVEVVQDDADYMRARADRALRCFVLRRTARHPGEAPREEAAGSSNVDFARGACSQFGLVMRCTLASGALTELNSLPCSQTVAGRVHLGASPCIRIPYKCEGMSLTTLAFC